MIGDPNTPASRGVSIIPYRQGKFAISKRLSPSDKCPGLWQFPGGLVEVEEDTVVAAQRELHEETGLNIPSQRFIFIGESPPLAGYKGEKYIGYRYGVVLFENEHLLNPEPEKHTAWEWVTGAELKNRAMLFGIMTYAFDFQRLLLSTNERP